MWIEITAGFLGISLILYCLLAGADFGGGILEFFQGKHRRKDQQELIAHAISPVWEANHIWLILAIVILFNGFPKAFTQISISLHIPLTLMLVGIILRGCAFTFSHYDAVKDQSQTVYSWIFKISSALTPLFLGIIVGAAILGRSGTSEPGYIAQYVSPWLNFFSASLGLFLCSLFTFLAAVYLVGETNDRQLQRIFKRKAIFANFAAILTGALVFVSAEMDGYSLLHQFLNDPGAWGLMALATLAQIPLWIHLENPKRSSGFILRILGGFQVTCILLGWFKIQFPTLVALAHPHPSITLYNGAAPASTLRYLVYALVGGSALIFPSLFFLLSVFKKLRTPL